jgi:3-oxoacyl-ACP reductase-like protein
MADFTDKTVGLLNQKRKDAKNMSTIQEKVVVIMGASSGIGEATTKKLAEEGAKLVRRSSRRSVESSN